METNTAMPCIDMQFIGVAVTGHRGREGLPLSSMQGTRTQALAAAAPEVQMAPPLFVSRVRLPKLGTLPTAHSPFCKTGRTTVSVPSGYYEG